MTQLSFGGSYSYSSPVRNINCYFSYVSAFEKYNTLLNILMGSNKIMHSWFWGGNYPAKR